MHLFHHTNPEHAYVSLIHGASNCYANWAPTKRIRAGDYGHLQHDYSFFVEGNIFDDGTAARLGIETTESHGDDFMWIEAVVNEETKANAAVAVTGQAGTVQVKKSFTVSHSHGAVLCMRKPRRISLTNEAQLRHLVHSDATYWEKGVLVSEVFTCHSWARLLAPRHKQAMEISLGTSEHTGHLGGNAQLEWRTTADATNFAAAHHDDEKEETRAYPLLKLIGRNHWYNKFLPVHGHRPVTEIEFMDQPLPLGLLCPPFGHDHHHEEETHPVELAS